MLATNHLETMRPHHLHFRHSTLPAWVTAIVMLTVYGTIAAPIVGDTIYGNLTVSGWGKFSGGVDLGQNGEVLVNWLPADLSNPFGTATSDIALAQGAFLWRDTITAAPSARNKMRLAPSNTLTLYTSNGTAALLLDPENGRISVLEPGSNSGICFGTNATPTLQATANGSAIFPALVTLQGGLQLTSGALQISDTTAATSSTTGALTLGGGLGAGMDSYFNGVRVGKGAASVVTNTVVGTSALGANLTSTGSAYGTCNTATGAYALKSNTTGYFNTASGAYALYANTKGYYNIAVGPYALYANTSGTYNMASGPYALYGNTSGSDNTASGTYSLYANTTGGYNAACGTYALYGNTFGSNNTASGAYSLYANTMGGYNAACGTYALYSNTTGTYNTASGAHALRSNTTGSSNTAAGTYALYSTTTGFSNSSFGMYSLCANTTGSNNVAVGAIALYANSLGTGNTALGYQALSTNTFGTNNVAVGTSAGTYQANATTPLTDPDNSVYIGANSKGKDNNDSNSIVIGATAIGEGANTSVIGNAATTKTHIFGELVATTATIGGAPVLTARSGTNAVLSNSAILALGNYSDATQPGAIVIGAYSQASRKSAIALGDSACAAGDFATAIQQAEASGEESFAANWGYAGGAFSLALAVGQAFGDSSIAIGGYDVAFGDTNYAMATGSVALGGRLNIATGNYSYAMGNRVASASAYSFVVGSQNLSASNSITPIGPNAWVEDSALLEVGNGNPDATTFEASNAITTLKNGQTTLTNKAWKANPAAPLADRDPGTHSGGNALVVEGHTVLKGKVIMEQSQGDISMGIYGDD